jgi:hypothetical protein
MELETSVFVFSEGRHPGRSRQIATGVRTLTTGESRV